MCLGFRAEAGCFDSFSSVPGSSFCRFWVGSSVAEPPDELDAFCFSVAGSSFCRFWVGSSVAEPPDELDVFCFLLSDSLVSFSSAGADDPVPFSAFGASTFFRQLPHKLWQCRCSLWALNTAWQLLHVRVWILVPSSNVSLQLSQQYIALAGPPFCAPQPW
jgi:hypothetical protein